MARTYYLWGGGSGGGGGGGGGGAADSKQRRMTSQHGDIDCEVDMKYTNTLGVLLNNALQGHTQYIDSKKIL